MNKKTLSLVLLLIAVLGMGGFTFAHGFAGVSATLGLTPPTILPDSPFYFIKDIGRGLERLFTFNPVKKAALELRIADEKLNELDILAESKPEAKNTLEKALTNYLDSQNRLQARLAALKDKNKNVDDLLQKLASRVIDHEKIFASLEEKFSKDEMAKTTAGIAENAKQALQLNAEKFKEKLKARLNAEAGDEKKEALQAVKKVKDADEELKNKLEDVGEVVAAGENTANANPTADEARTALSKWQKEIQEYENDLAKTSLSAKDAAEANQQLAEAKKHWGFAKDAFDKGNYQETMTHLDHVQGFLEKLEAISKSGRGEEQELKVDLKVDDSDGPLYPIESPAGAGFRAEARWSSQGFAPGDTCQGTGAPPGSPFDRSNLPTQGKLAIGFTQGNYTLKITCFRGLRTAERTAPLPQTSDSVEIRVLPPMYPYDDFRGSTNEFKIKADDLGFYPSDPLSVAKDAKVKIIFETRENRVYYGGLDFRSPKFTTVFAKPGESITAEFTADESFTISSYWPSSGVKKADLPVVIK